MNIILLTPDEITDKDVQSFWDQGVCMDDWDYMFLLPSDTEMITTCYDNEMVMEPINYTIQRLLNGSCENRWYMGFYKEEPCVIGIAYHS